MPEPSASAAPDDWLQVADRAPDRYPAVYRYGREGVVVFEYEGRLYGLSRWCPHGWADLKAGRCVDGAVHCPLHGFRFDLATGQGLSHAAFRLTPYEVRIDPTGVYLRPASSMTEPR